MPELTIPGLLFICLLPFALVALWTARDAAREWKRVLAHQDTLALERSERDQKDWTEGTVTQAAVEAVVTTEEWARRVNYHDLAKTEYATTRMAELLARDGIELPHEELVKRVDAALTRVRPGLQDEPTFTQYAGQGPEQDVHQSQAALFAAMYPPTDRDLARENAHAATQQQREPTQKELAEYHQRMNEEFTARSDATRAAAEQSAD